MEKARVFHVCKCFYRRNIFLKDIKLHVDFLDRSQFLKSYRNVLNENGFDNDAKIEKLIEEIEEEVKRRKRLELDSLERKKAIESSYSPLFPKIYKLEESFLSPKFLEMVNYCRDESSTFEGLFDYIQETEVSRTYVLPVFTEDFCKLFIEELKHFEESALPKGRPNTMNKYGVLLDELGFDPFFTKLRQEYLIPVTKLLYPDIGGNDLDSHKVFIVKYKQGEDLDLDYHYDNAEITLNVALSLQSEYSGGKLYFGAMRTESESKGLRKEVAHQPTMGLLHRGQHLHGALPITSGERYNLILWMRSSRVRNTKCPMCDTKPDLQEAVGFGDGFTKPETVDVCSVI